MDNHLRYGGPRLQGARFLGHVRLDVGNRVFWRPPGRPGDEKTDLPGFRARGILGVSYRNLGHLLEVSMLEKEVK